MRLLVSVEGGDCDYDLEKLQTWASNTNDGRYVMDIQPFDGVVANMMRYYRGVVLSDVAKERGESDYEQHELNLTMFAPKIVESDGAEFPMRSREFKKHHWISYLDDIIHFYSLEGIYIRKPGETGYEEYNQNDHEAGG